MSNNCPRMMDRTMRLIAEYWSYCEEVDTNAAWLCMSANIDRLAEGRSDYDDLMTVSAVARQHARTAVFADRFGHAWQEFVIK